MDTSWIPLASLIISTLALPTLAGLIWKDIHEKKKEKSKEEKEKKKREFQENVREVIQDELRPLNKTVKVMESKINLVADGTESSLRNDIKDCFYSCSDKGYRNDYDFKNMHDLYDSYKRLGGNSFIEDIMHRFEALPPKEEYMRRKAEEDKHKKAEQLKLARLAKGNKKLIKEGGASANGN